MQEILKACKPLSPLRYSMLLNTPNGDEENDTISEFMVNPTSLEGSEQTFPFKENSTKVERFRIKDSRKKSNDDQIHISLLQCLSSLPMIVVENSNPNIANEGEGHSLSKPFDNSNKVINDINDKYLSSMNENTNLKKLLKQNETTIEELKTEVKQKTASLQVHIDIQINKNYIIIFKEINHYVCLSSI